ncbi:MAG TPA: methyltransferase domain-containing protein [Ktedonobacteraceae bacterium]
MTSMKPKPSHLGLKYAEQFKDTSIVEVYHHRPPYSDEAIRLLLKLVTDEPRAILDVGCGTGDLARRLVSGAERVDAVDFSQAMLDKGRTLPGGDHPHLNWMYGRVEDVALQPPYALITAGDSLHWMQWEIVFSLFHHILTPHGALAIVGRGTEHNLWDNDLRAVIARFSTNREFRPYNLVEELEQRHLFQKHGSLRTQLVPFVQSGDAYIQSIHSMNGFSRERMGEKTANAFDEEVRKVIAPFLRDGLLTLSTFNMLVWGIPHMQ